MQKLQLRKKMAAMESGAGQQLFAAATAQEPPSIEVADSEGSESGECSDSDEGSSQDESDSSDDGFLMLGKHSNKGKQAAKQASTTMAAQQVT
jgi:hypothetical protein